MFLTLVDILTFHKFYTKAKYVKNFSTFFDKYPPDDWTNITKRVYQLSQMNLMDERPHPLHLLKERIKSFFNENFKNKAGNPLFPYFENFSNITSVSANFDSLLVPLDHPTRKKSESFYLNSQYLLRTHTSCHQVECISSGLDNFLVFGNVFRRDTINKTHFPVFHQLEGVKLFSKLQLLDMDSNVVDLFGKNGEITSNASDLVEKDLKKTLQALAESLFGLEVEFQWVPAYFPFTHPSWELEIKLRDEWTEVLGCGIMAQKILTNAGTTSKVGWAFGIGLDRIAMKLYSIPDIRWMWSEDAGFLNQFNTDDLKANIKMKEVSKHPACIYDISFWIPEQFHENDFFDIVRNVAGDMVERISLIDKYEDKKDSRTSHCYRIVYRHFNKTLTKNVINSVHKSIESQITETLNCAVR